MNVLCYCCDTLSCRTRSRSHCSLLTIFSASLSFNLTTNNSSSRRLFSWKQKKQQKKTIKNTHTPQIHFQYLITSYCQGCAVESGCWCFSSEVLSWPFTCVVVFSSTLSSSSCVWRRWSSSCSARHSSSACCCSTSISCSDSQRRADRRSRKSCSRSLRVTKSNVTTPDSKGTVAKVNL